MQPHDKGDFELEVTLRGATNEELLTDLSVTARGIGRNTLTMEQYNRHGTGHAATFVRRFGSWPKALELAGLEPSRSKIGITNEELFDNLRELWVALGRQPRYGDVRSPESRYSAGTYAHRFGSWTRALSSFVNWAKAESVSEIPHGQTTALPENLAPAIETTRTNRQPSDRQRFSILLRDGFACTSCGASPLSTRGTELHVDHVLPWSKGGETEDANLATKCRQCNLGKGDLLEDVGRDSTSD